MTILMAGVSHRGCPIEIRERLAALRGPAVREGLAAAGWRECVVLSTCNRFEVYASGAPAGAPAGAAGLAAFLDRVAGVAVSEHAVLREGAEAVRHLFQVASGLDSLVLGECEILGQVREAYESALEAETTAKLTNVAFQRALFLGKAVRASTAISMGQLSTASVAVELAKRIFGRLAESEVLVLGAGEMAERTARHLLSAKVPRLYIANRTWERGRDLAERLGRAAEPVRWDSLDRLLGRADVVVASTGADRPVVTRAAAEDALARRGGRSLFLIDIAMPRDVEPSVAELDGVYLYRLEDLAAIAEENASRRRVEVDAARALVLREADSFAAWLDSLRGGREIALRHSQLRPLGRPAAVRA